MPKETNPEVIGFYATKTLKEQREATIQINAALTSEQYRGTLIFAGCRMYDAGVRAVYTALCQIELEGRSGKIDVDEVKALREGIEEFLVPRKR